MAEKLPHIIRPHQGFQEKFICSNVDFLVGGSGMGVGKSFAALLMAAEQSYDPNFRMVYLRRNLGDIRAGGGGTDEAQKIYGSIATLKTTESPRLTFKSGAFIDFTHMSDQTEDKVLERIKGWQYSCIYIDEATGFEWSTIRLLMSRNRSQAKWSGKMRLTCNPKRNHWLRVWVDWYLDEKGFPIPDRVGVIRYFFVNGKDVTDVIFGDTKEEVYSQCKSQIDNILKAQGDKFTYKDLIKSTTFYTGKLSENKALLQNDASYLGSVAAMGEKQRLANMMACWNVDTEEDVEAPITPASARAILTNEEQTTGEYYITADLADVGTDNTVILAWNGYHIIDYKILPRATTDMNVTWIKRLANKYNVADSHIIFDSRRAPYVHERIPEAVAYDSCLAPRGLYKRNFQMLKDELYMRVVEALNIGNISICEEIANSPYIHQKQNSSITILEEFAEECSVVQFFENANGKKRLYSKKEMNQKLGKSRSMDLLDPIAMRFLPDLSLDYGEERKGATQREDTPLFDKNYINIYDESFWC